MNEMENNDESLKIVFGMAADIFQMASWFGLFMAILALGVLIVHFYAFFIKIRMDTMNSRMKEKILSWTYFFLFVFGGACIFFAMWIESILIAQIGGVAIAVSFILVIYLEIISVKASAKPVFRR